MTPATKVTHPITGERRRCDDWARKLGSNHDSVVSKRLNKGWSLIDALESPVDRARTTVPRLWGAHHDPDDFLKGYWG